ncbi:unnamed protein product [Orchesella dallaii]|uniref:Iduronate 2-sulfatase n=1 Tax=Orchesella dallaii TaxID=48710 RepID=A0ABP1RB74_9HEXA
MTLSGHILGWRWIVRRKVYKLILRTILLLMICLSFTYLSDRGPDQYEINYHKRPSVSSTLLKENTDCAFPILDPFEPAMKRFFRLRSRRLGCSQFVTYFSEGMTSNLSVDGDHDQPVIQRSADFPKDKFTCCFEVMNFLQRPPYNYHEKEGKVCKIIREDVTPLRDTVEHVFIKCFPLIPPSPRLHDANLSRVLHLRSHPDHNEILTFIPSPKAPTPTHPEDERLNVIIFVLDSISRPNFIRQMRHSFSYLVNELHAVDLQGYASVGVGTLINSFALLLGKTYAEVRNTCWKRDNATFDHCDWIWKHFSKKGYTTLFAEDYHSVYNFYLQGFKTPPTSYYLYPFSKWLGYRVLKEDFGNKDCVRNTSTVSKLVEYAKKASSVLSSVPNFQLYWASLLNYLETDAVLVDKPLVELLQFWNQSGILNNTVVVLASDHGWKAGDIMSHSQARLENRMPFCFLLFPKRFQILNPEAYQNLLINKFRVTTHHDVHATLLHILQSNNAFNLKSHYEGTEAKSRSLFLPIPKNRNCEMLGIQESWCICGVYKPIPKESELTNQLAITAVTGINKMLEGYRKCNKYQLWNIIDAEEKVGMPGALQDISKVGRKTYRLVIQVRPKGASFQVILYKDESTGNITLDKGIFRLNTFLHHCIHDQQLYRLCTCKKSWDNLSMQRYSNGIW